VQGSRLAVAGIPSELRTEPLQGSRLRRVRSDTAQFECRRKAEQEWYRRGIYAFVSFDGDKGVF